jgi:hypothetical protein
MTSVVSDSNKPLAICVLGMHRSGTSAMTGLLHLLGVHLGTNIMKPAPDNPKGFWEHYEIVGCHVSMLEVLGSYMDDILPLPDGWQNKASFRAHYDFLKRLILTEFAGKPMWGFKDPRAARLLPLWNPLFEEVGSSPRFVIVVRNPDEIAMSMTARGGHSYNQTLMVTLDHMLSAERHTRGQKRVIVGYDQLLADWWQQVNRIGAALGISKWPNPPESIASQAGDFLDPSLRHNYSLATATAERAIASRSANPQIAQWAFRGFQIFQSAANDEGALDLKAIDQLASEVQSATPFLAAWRPARVKKDQFAKLTIQASRLEQEVKRLTKENEELRSRLPK